MKPKWTPYRLGDFLKRNLDSVEVTDFNRYKRITIRTKGQGIALRDEVAGVEVGTKNQFRVRPNQFLLSKIDAMNGAFGIVPEECDGGIITGNFWTYDINEELIDRAYLNLLCQKQVFTIFSVKASEGTTNRKYLREDKFLDLTLELPEKRIQSQIVSRIESVKERLAEITILRQEEVREIKNLLFSKYTEVVEDANWERMEDVAPIVRREVAIDENGSYPELGVRSFGKGTFHKPALSGLDVGSKTLYQIKSGDLVFSNVFAWEGAIAVAKEEDDSRYGSHRFISCVADKEKALEEFLCFHFLTPRGLEDINTCSPGGAGRNKTLGLTKLMALFVPVPDIEKQREFVSLLKKVKSLQAQHIALEKELTTVIPNLLHSLFNNQ